MPQPRRSTKARPPSPIIRIAHSPKPWELSAEEKVLVKNLMCPGATDQEFQLCVAEAQHRRLDPLKKQIHFVPRWNSDAENVDGSKGRKVWVAQTSIDGLRHLAARDHADYGTEDEPEFGPMIEVQWDKWSGSGNNRKSYAQKPFKAPEWARVGVWKKGATRPTVATVFWNEIYPNVDYAPIVREKPRLMLGKCAAAQAIRKAYPETGGMYIPEEFAGKLPDFTPEGRRIIYPELAEQAGSLEAAQAVAERKIAEHKAKEVKPGGTNIPTDIRTTDGGFPADQTRPVIELDWSQDESSPVVRGDLAGILDTLQANLHMTWALDWWHIEPRDEEPLRKICEHYQYELKQVLPSKSSGVPSVAPEAPKEPGKSGASKAEGTGPAIALASGTVNQVLPSMTKAGAPVRQIKTNGHWHNCYRNSLFEYLDKALGREVELILDAKKNVVGIRRIGSRMFDDENLPIIENSEDRTGKLF